MAISNLVLTQQIYSEETNDAHAHNRDRVPLIQVRNNRNDHFRYFLGVRVRSLEVSAY